MRLTPAGPDSDAPSTSAGTGTEKAMTRSPKERAPAPSQRKPAPLKVETSDDWDDAPVSRGRSASAYERSKFGMDTDPEAEHKARLEAIRLKKVAAEAERAKKAEEENSSLFGWLGKKIIPNSPPKEAASSSSSSNSDDEDTSDRLKRKGLVPPKWKKDGNDILSPKTERHLETKQFSFNTPGNDKKDGSSSSSSSDDDDGESSSSSSSSSDDPDGEESSSSDEDKPEPPMQLLTEQLNRKEVLSVRQDDTHIRTAHVHVAFRSVCEQ